MPASDSIYMTIPSSLSYVLDLPLPPSSSVSSNSSLYIPLSESPQDTLSDNDTDHEDDTSEYRLDLSLTRDPWPLSPLYDISSLLVDHSFACPSVGKSGVVLDWPPNNLPLFPADENYHQGDGTDFLVSDVSSGLL